MIIPAGTAGVAFSEAAEGDVRNDASAHAGLSRRLGLSPNWATVRQVHGSEVRMASEPGVQGEADALWTERPGLPVAVYTADCFGVVMLAEAAVGIAHAGWRGTAAGVVPELRTAMTAAGHPAEKAVIGPGIRSCCFEVGEEVAALFPGHITTTTWGTTSVDLPAVIADQVGDLEIEIFEDCTAHDHRYFSHRRDGLQHRQVALGWMS
jgi:polyphenol oxidase